MHIVLTPVQIKKMFWGYLALLSLAMEGTALFYQYQLDYGPCVLCIHIRAWVALLFIGALCGLFTIDKPVPQATGLFISLAASAGMLERSWLTLGIERGTVDGSCTIDSGFPAWLPLDQWSPWMFEPWESCGYTPELLFGITMAEGLVATAVWLLLLLSSGCYYLIKQK